MDLLLKRTTHGQKRLQKNIHSSTQNRASSQL
uniref:Uncharacterized protein n=1 Tax=Anguilla anguilla TaxID=7936 RepID=A0A0E9VR54_ANGAN